MTTINYKIGSHTGNIYIANTYSEAVTLKDEVIIEETKFLNWWPITCEITNNDGTITHCGMDANGNPVEMNEEGVVVPYVDKTQVPNT